MVSIDSVKEKHLINRVQNGDILAFAQLIRQHSSRVLTLIKQIVHSPMDADDIAQEVFIKVFKGIDQFRGDSSFSTWLYKITKNACYSYLQKKQPAMVSLDIESDSNDSILVPDLEQDIDKIIAQKDINERVLKCLSKLPPKYKIVIHLFYYEGLQYREISDILEIPLGTVQTHLFRALKSLRKEVRETLL